MHFIQFDSSSFRRIAQTDGLVTNATPRDLSAEVHIASIMEPASRP